MAFQATMLLLFLGYHFVYDNAYMFVAIETKTFSVFAFHYLFERFFKGKLIQENTCYQVTGKGIYLY